MGGPSNSGDTPQPRPRASLFGLTKKRVSSSGEPPRPPSPKEPPRKPRRATLSSISGLLTFVLVGALVAVGAIAWLLLESRKPGPLAEDKVVLIGREDDGGSIADQLERAGVIESAMWFNILTLLDSNRGALKRGEYSFKAGASMNEIENELVARRVLRHPLTIPEGLTSDQIVQKLRDPEWDGLLVGEIREPPHEGSLMPDTYYFERGDTRQSLLTRMARAQSKTVEETWKNRAPDLPIKSPGEMVTLASIVEKETGKADERPRVAGVFINRLQKHMRLESDPTIVYGLVFGKGVLGHSITRAELDQATPYNTYKIEGLPPGPISNPGKAALEAVAHPVRSKDLYFVADGTGGHAFAETLDQHLKNVAHWREIEKDPKEKLAPDAAPTRGSIESVDPASFGALTAPQPAPAASTALLARLAKIGADRKAKDDVLASLTASTQEGKSIEELGAVVAGVNDSPPEGDAFTDGNLEGAGVTTVASVPLSPTMLADQKAREAKYGTPARATVFNVLGVAAVAAVPQPGAPTGRPRAFDASEGTRLDPLLNKTYDLSFAKVVPTLQ
jgi:UPF0755 protein